ncbi:MAG: phage portal protein, partial [Pontiella sp.]|nr:phage portal protein [Pontiella sp.]
MNKLKRFIYNRVTRWASDTPGAARYWPMPVSRTAGERVTTETALTYSAIWRAVTLISDTIATLPWQMRERTVNDRNQVGSRHLFSHPADPLLSISPNSEMNALVFRQALIAHGLTWGNGYAEITRDGASRPAELWIIEPERVKLDRTESGRLVYVVTNGGAA